MFKMFSYIIYLITLYVEHANPQIYNTSLSCIATIPMRSTLSLYAIFPGNPILTPPGCTVHVNCSVLHLCCVLKYSAHTYTHNFTLHSPVIRMTFTNTHLEVHTTYTLVITPIYRRVIKRYYLLIILTYTL